MIKIGLASKKNEITFVLGYEGFHGKRGKDRDFILRP